MKLLKRKIWIAAYVDTSDTSDGKPRIGCVSSSKEEVEAWTKADIQEWADDRAGENIIVDFEKLRAYHDCEDGDSCEWSIESEYML